jgi:uncharacterized short protein YbdD (DUF466 family)
MKTRISRAAQTAWRWLREVIGDAAYENYVRHEAARKRPSGAPEEILTRAEFYSDSLRRKYSSINRCC